MDVGSQGMHGSAQGGIHEGSGLSKICRGIDVKKRPKDNADGLMHPFTCGIGLRVVAGRSM